MPVALFIIGGILLFFFLLLSLRVKLTFTLREEVGVTLSILFFRFSLYPRKMTPRKARRELEKARRKEKKRKKKQNSQKEAGKTALKDKHPKEEGIVEKIAALRGPVALLVRKTGKHLHLHTARLYIAVATGDAASTAILCGAVSQSLSYLLALLDRVTRLCSKPREVAVFPDYLSEKSRADVKLVFFLRVGGAFALLFSFALAFLRAKLQNKNRKNPPSPEKKGDRKE